MKVSILVDTLGKGGGGKMGRAEAEAAAEAEGGAGAVSVVQVRVHRQECITYYVVHCRFFFSF